MSASFERIYRQRIHFDCIAEGVLFVVGISQLAVDEALEVAVVALLHLQLGFDQSLHRAVDISGIVMNHSVIVVSHGTGAVISVGPIVVHGPDDQRIIVHVDQALILSTGIKQCETGPQPSAPSRLQIRDAVEKLQHTRRFLVHTGFGVIQQDTHRTVRQRQQSQQPDRQNRDN